MKYIPNMSHAGTYRRIEHAYGYANGVLSYNKPQQWHTRTFDEHFGRNDTNIGKFNRHYLVTCTKDNWSKDQGTCKEYILNDIGTAYIKHLLVTKAYISYNEYLDSRDTVPETVREYVRDTATDIGDLNEINSRTFKIGDQAKYPIVHDLQDDFTRCLVIQNNTKKYHKELTTYEFEYKEKSHRLFHGLQNVKKDYKREILANAGLKFNYDIECCAPTLLTQCSRKGMNILNNLQYPAIDDYLDDRTAVRERLSKDLDIPVDNIKKILTSLFNGAKLSASYYCDTFVMLDKDTEKMKRLQSHEFIVSLRKDVEMMWEAIALNGFIEYSRNKNGSVSKKSMTGKWDLYYRLERRVLESVRTYLTATDNKHFCEHDGWATVQEIDVDDIQRYVSNDIGYSVRICKT